MHVSLFTTLLVLREPCFLMTDYYTKETKDSFGNEKEKSPPPHVPLKILPCTYYIVPRSRPAAAAGAETIEILIYDMKIPLSPQSQRTHPAITKWGCRNVKNLGWEKPTKYVVGIIFPLPLFEKD